MMLTHIGAHVGTYAYYNTLDTCYTGYPDDICSSTIIIWSNSPGTGARKSSGSKMASSTLPILMLRFSPGHGLTNTEKYLYEKKQMCSNHALFHRCSTDKNNAGIVNHRHYTKRGTIYSGQPFSSTVGVTMKNIIDVRNIRKLCFR